LIPTYKISRGLDNEHFTSLFQLLLNDMLHDLRTIFK